MKQRPFKQYLGKTMKVQQPEERQKPCSGRMNTSEKMSVKQSPQQLVLKLSLVRLSQEMMMVFHVFHHLSQIPKKHTESKIASWTKNQKALNDFSFLIETKSIPATLKDPHRKQKKNSQPP